MKITNIRVAQKRNLGSYESLEFMAEAVIDEGENLSEATNKVFNYVDWHSQKHKRDAQAATQMKIVADEQQPEEARKAAEKWLDKYNERKKEVESL